MIRAVKAGEWERGPNGIVTAGGVRLLPEECTERLVAVDPAGTATLPAGSGLVVLDVEVGPELAAEGIARDLVRVVQQARKQAGRDVADRIALTIDAPEAVLAAAREYEQFIAGEVLARRVDHAPVPDGFAGVVGDGVPARITVALVSA